MNWTMNGGRPVSGLALEVMLRCGAEPDGKGGWKFTKKKPAKKRESKKSK